MDIIEQLKRDEGVRNFPYTDTVGKLTIGVGHNLTDKGISDNAVNFLLQEDIAEVTNQLQSRLPYFEQLDSIRQSVLINMAFNLGFGGLEKFSAMLQYVAQGDWNDAAIEMLDSLWAKQVGARATRLATQMRTGEWQ
jgi:lysozyme